MNAQTRLSAKGQVIIPKDVRDRLHWEPGLPLDVIETGDGVSLRPRRAEKKLSLDQAIAKFREIYVHKGPPVTLEEMDSAVDDMLHERWNRSTR